ncbi:hypothetical protein NsoK4_00875 [Nitrosopumilus sp. K4]|uniref:CxxC-x17-CxxC domain-containing protein n=1 Tax=Nitrosopumilus sp. K4 TaxID=2795383 RepID=UPI001BA5C698|nr:CxxC-x17-CxxC domain-containing protein [Nitrosopumilus sp. K4]QUC64869.1 hypothetical protein NsoK4_00875 [Nitrosopumilus sp. K4]
MDLYRAKYSDKKPDKKFKSGKSSDRYSRDDRPSRSFRNSRQSTSRSRDREMFSAVCGDCGNECKLPFEPKFNKPVYCSECFEKNEPRKSNRSNFDRDNRSRSRDRDFRKPHYDRDNRSRSRDRDFRSHRDDYTPKPKLSKLQKKHDSFYANGSEKFYESLKEKLFEILGGKVCSSCGFKDPRALGFSSMYDEEAFDQIRRGGFASSWGKYISEPDLAKKELRVLCLNCNEIREPIKKKESEKPKKKSRYFPR